MAQSLYLYSMKKAVHYIISYLGVSMMVVGFIWTILDGIAYLLSKNEHLQIRFITFIIAVILGAVVIRKHYTPAKFED